MKKPRTRHRPPQRPVFARTILAVLLAGAAGVQAQTWIGLGLTNNWADPLNWSGAVPPTSGSLTALTFAGNLRLGPVQNIAFPFQLNALTFASGAGSFSLSGGGLRFVGAASHLTQNSANAVTIDTAVQIDGHLVYSGSGSATLSGAVSRSGPNPATATFLTKTGTGTLTLTGANPFDGTVTIEQGQIRLAQTLALQNSTVVIGTNNGLNLNGLAAAALGNLAGSGALSLGATRLTVGQNNQSPSAYSGTITGSTGSLTKIGTGTTTLSGTGSSFDNLLVQQGKITLSGGAVTLTNPEQGLRVGINIGGVSGGPILEVINGAVMSAAGDTVQVDGAADTRLDILGTGSRLTTGFQTLVGNHATGSLNVGSGGVLQAGTYLAFGFDAGGVGTLNIAAGGTATSTTGLLGTLTGSTGTANVTGPGASWVTTRLGLGGFSEAQRGGTGTLNVGDGGQVHVIDELKFWTADSSITVNGGSLRAGKLASENAVGTIGLVANPAGGAALTIDGASGASTFAGTISGTGSLAKSGDSVQTLAGANSFSGETIITGGQIRLGHALALQNSSVVLGVNDGLNLNGLASATLGNLSGTGKLNLGATQLVVGDDNLSPQAFTGTITGSTGSLIKRGTGTTKLAGAGSSFGNLAVLGGVLDVTSGPLTLTSETSDGNSAIIVGGGTLNIVGGATVNANAPNRSSVFVDGGAGASLVIDGPGSRLNNGFQVVVGNRATGEITIRNAGRLNGDFGLLAGLAGGSHGSVTIESGAIASAPVVALGTFAGSTGVATVTGAGSLLSAATSLGMGGLGASQRGGTGTLTIANGGAVNAAATQFWSSGSAMVIDAGTLFTEILTSEGTVGGIDLVSDPLAGAALTINGTSGNHAYSGSISGDGSLLKTGASTQRLLGSNTFTGTVTVRGGTLEMASGAASYYDVAGGGTLRLGARTLGFAVVQADPGSTVLYTNTTVIGGTLIGSGTHDIAAVNRMVGTSVANGVALTPRNGATFVGVVSGGTITNAAGRSLTWTGGSNAVGTVAVAGITTVSGWSSGGVVEVASGGALVNAGSSHLVLAGGSRTTVGSVAAPGGTITLQNGTRLQLNGALLVNNGTIDGPVDVNFGSLAKGGGVYGAVNVTDGGRFSPGNSPGNTASGDVTWGAGGTYLVELAAATGTAGTHWDLWTIDGTLDITAGTSANSRFTISLATLDGTDQAALLAGFDNRHAYRWQIVDTTGGVSGFDAAKLKLDTTGFLNAPGGGHFQLALSDGDVFVDFVPAPIPEPHEWILMLAGLGCVAGVARRRRRQSAQTA